MRTLLGLTICAAMFAGGGAADAVSSVEMPRPVAEQQPQTRPGTAVQAPARDTKVTRAGTAVIKGRVTAADTGEPLRRARVALSGAPLERTLYMSTDAQGRYEFTEVPAGRFTIVASKSVYVTLQYGQRRPFEPGRPFEVADGATIEKLDLALPRGGIVSGTVVDDLGEPIAGARVSAYRSRYESGKRKLASIGRSVETNDLGQYRLYGLQPGFYCVGTGAPLGPEGFAFAPSYYPGTLNSGEAQRVEVTIGQERSGVDITQPPGRLARISGSIIDPAGRPLVAATVSAVNPTTGNVFSAPVAADGSFQLANVSPGDYGLAASLRDTASGEVQIAMLPLTVIGDDVSGLVLTLHAGCHVYGRVTLEDGSAPPLRPVGLRVDPFPLPSDVPLRMQSPGLQGIINDDWSFEMRGVGGSMLFRMAKPPNGYMVKSVVLDGRDVTDVPIDIRGTEQIRGLQVVLTRQVTEVSGFASDAKGSPVHEYSVVIFADEAARWKYPSRFLATARPDQQGRYRVPNLPPGRYLAVALEYLEDGQAEDPDYLDTLRPLGARFTLGEGETKTVDLTIPKTPGS